MRGKCWAELRSWVRRTTKVRRPGPAPAGRSLSFAGPNESNQSKGPDAWMKSLASEAVRRLTGALRTEVHAVNCLSGAHRWFRSPGLRARCSSPSPRQRSGSSVFGSRGQLARGVHDRQASSEDVWHTSGVQARHPRHQPRAMRSEPVTRASGRWSRTRQTVDRMNFWPKHAEQTDYRIRSEPIVSEIPGPLLWLLSFGPANESDPPAGAGPGTVVVHRLHREPTRQEAK